MPSALAGKQGCTCDPWMASAAPQGNNMQTASLGTWAPRQSLELRHGSSGLAGQGWQHIPGSRRLGPRPGAQGMCLPRGRRTIGGNEPRCAPRWRCPAAPRCCPWQTEASGLSQPWPHVAGTLLFVLVSRLGSSAALGTCGQSHRHLMVQPMPGKHTVCPPGWQASGPGQLRHRFWRGTEWAPEFPKSSQGRTPG